MPRNAIHEVLKGAPNQHAWQMDWRGDRLDGARFDLGDEYGACPNREGECELIEAVLCLPHTGALRRLDLCVTDFDISLVRGVRAIASMPRPDLRHLALRVRGFSIESLERRRFVGTDGKTLSYPTPWDSDEGWPLIPAADSRALVKAAPRLETLTLVGDHLLDEIWHDHLTALSLYGCDPVLGCGLVQLYESRGRSVRLPNLEQLTFYLDSSAGMDPDYLCFEPDRLPALRNLRVMGPNLDESLAWFASCAILPQLRNLTIPGIFHLREETIRPLVGAFAHLDELVIQTIQLKDLARDAVLATLREAVNTVSGQMSHGERLMTAAAWHEFCGSGE